MGAQTSDLNERGLLQEIISERGSGERTPEEYDRAEAALSALLAALNELYELETWVSRMPDAGFNNTDPRWDWWHERPQPSFAVSGGRVTNNDALVSEAKRIAVEAGAEENKLTGEGYMYERGRREAAEAILYAGALAADEKITASAFLYPQRHRQGDDVAAPADQGSGERELRDRVKRAAELTRWHQFEPGIPSSHCFACGYSEDHCWHDGFAALSALLVSLARSEQLVEAVIAYDESASDATHHHVYDPACVHCQREREMVELARSVVSPAGEDEGLTEPEDLAEARHAHTAVGSRSATPCSGSVSPPLVDEETP